MSLITNEHLTRQTDLIASDLLTKYPVTIIGAGAIGSFTSLALAKMGVVRQTVFDFDTISIENMNSQFYRFKDIGQYKVHALHDLVEDFTGISLNWHAERFASKHTEGLTGIIIVAVDSMEARRTIYNWIKDAAFGVKLIIDPRMSAETYAQYTIDPFLKKDQDTYAKVLQSDEESVQERCTAKSTIYTALLASGYIAKTVKQYLCGQEYTRCLQWDIKATNNQMIVQGSNPKPLSQANHGPIALGQSMVPPIQ